VPVPSRRLVGLLGTAALVLAACGADDGATDATDAGDGTTTTTAADGRAGDTGVDRDDVGFQRLEGVTTADDFVDDLGAEGLERWQDEFPTIEDVRIPSRVDGEEQPALWLPPAGDGPQPLIVALHSWSTGYLQHTDIPFAAFAEREGWAMVHPEFRGVNERPEATGSDLAVADVVDAVDFALEAADVDGDRVFVVGFSGGGHLALLMAGRHPDRFAGAVSWVPIHDLVDWYAHNDAQSPEPAYVGQIEASCGGVPTEDDAAAEECLHRSPTRHLDGARDAGIPVYVGAGLDDGTVPPDHALRAFDALADEDDRFSEGAVAAVADNELPGELGGEVEAEHHFGAADPEVHLARSSGPATVVLFEGGHDMVYNPGLAWMHELAVAAGP
jgi:dienelactone hydrolase